MLLNHELFEVNYVLALLKLCVLRVNQLAKYFRYNCFEVRSYQTFSSVRRFFKSRHTEKCFVIFLRTTEPSSLDAIFQRSISFNKNMHIILHNNISYTTARAGSLTIKW